MAAARHLRRPRRAEPQPAGRRGAAHRAAGAQLARALPHLPAEPRRRARRPARAVPRPAAAGAAPLRRRGPRAHARDGGGGLPDLPGPAALGARGRAGLRAAGLAGSPSRRRPATSPARPAQLLERLGRATQLRFPVVGDLARSVRFRWFDQPAVDAERADVLAGCATSSPRWPRDGGLPTGPPGSTRWPPSRSRSSASWPSGSSRASRPGSRCWRCWPAVTTASTTCTTCEAIDDRRPPVRGRRLHPRRPADPAGLDGRHRRRAGRPRGRAGRRGRRLTSRRARRTTRPSSTSTCTGPTRPSRPTRRASGSGRCVERAAVRPRRTPGLRRRLRRRRPAGRLLRLPARRATARWPRTT